MNNHIKTALITAAAIVFGYVVATPLTSSMNRMRAEKSVRAEFATTVPHFSQALSNGFPDEYADLIKTVSALAVKGDAEKVDATTQTLVSKIRTDNAHYIYSAPDRLNRIVLSSHVSLLEAVRSNYGVVQCANAALNGAHIVDQRSNAPLTAPMAEHSTAIFRALGAGRVQKIHAGIPTDTPGFAPIVELVQQSGFDQKAFDAVAAGDANHPEYCDVIISFVTILSEFEGQDAIAMRAQFAYELVAN